MNGVIRGYVRSALTQMEDKVDYVLLIKLISHGADVFKSYDLVRIGEHVYLEGRKTTLINFVEGLSIHEKSSLCYVIPSKSLWVHLSESW